MCAVTSDAPALRRSLALLRYVNEKLVPADVEALLLTGRATSSLTPRTLTTPLLSFAVACVWTQRTPLYPSPHGDRGARLLRADKPSPRAACSGPGAELRLLHVRKLPKYHILRARLLGKQGLADKALAQLQWRQTSTHNGLLIGIAIGGHLVGVWLRAR